MCCSGVMVLAAELCGLPTFERRARTPQSFNRAPKVEETSCNINQQVVEAAVVVGALGIVRGLSLQVNLDLAFADGHEVSLEDLDAVVVGPDGTRMDEQAVQLLKTLTARGAMVSLVPPLTGPYEASRRA